MIIECPYCNSRVDAKEHGQRVDPNGPDDGPFNSRVVIGECPSCQQTLVGKQEEIETDWGSSWSDADRLWPKPKRTFDGIVPEIIEVSLNEAEICFGAGAYAACAVMCGRALEGMCVHFQTKKKTLAEGLKELEATNIIDQRLFSWGDELRKVRNLGAHASSDRVPRKDAEDVLDFLHAIVNYVFVLSKQFKSFMDRRSPKMATKDMLKAASDGNLTPGAA